MDAVLPDGLLLSNFFLDWLETFTSFLTWKLRSWNFILDWHQFREIGKMWLIWWRIRYGESKKKNYYFKKVVLSKKSEFNKSSLLVTLCRRHKPYQCLTKHCLYTTVNSVHNNHYNIHCLNCRSPLSRIVFTALLINIRYFSAQIIFQVQFIFLLLILIILKLCSYLPQQ